MQHFKSNRTSNSFSSVLRPWRFYLAGMLFFSFHLLSAQEDGDTPEEVYQLSPFQIDASEDVGYRSTNTISGTSLNTAIKDIPMNIEVINAEFINDIGATNFKESLSYSSGVFLDTFIQSTGQSRDGANARGANEVNAADASASSRGGIGGRFDNGTIIRGYNVPFQNRDGFRYGGLIAQYGVILGGIVDTTNVERMEVVRGPNSLLYGIGVLSGIVNIIPKRPLSASAQRATIGVGSEGYLRGTVDVTGPISDTFLGGQLNYRFATAWEERDHWTDWRGKELEYYVGQLQWNNDKMTILLEGQYADQNESGIGAQHIYDNTFAAYDQNARNEFFEQFNWTKDLGGHPESYRVTGPDTYHNRRETNILANIDITPIENLTISAGMFLTDAKEDEFNTRISTLTNIERSLDLKGVIIQRPNDPNTENRQEILDWIAENVTINPNLGLPMIPGDQRNPADYRTVRYWWQKDPEDTTTEQYRLRAAYNFDSKFFFDTEAKHTFLVGRHDIKDEANFTIGNASVSWQYANKQELADNDALQFRNINDHSIIRYNGEPLGIPGREYRNVEVWFTGHYALYQGDWFDEKLGVILGVRHDRYHSRDRQWDRFDELAEFGSDYSGPPLEISPSDVFIDNPNNETFGFFPLPPGVSEYTPNPDEAETEVTKTIALNWDINDDLTLYGVRAEGITPNTGARDGNLVGIPSEQGTSEELGIKFDLDDGKFSGTVSVYRISRENALYNFTGAPAPARWNLGIIHPTDEPGENEGFEPILLAEGGVPLSYGLDTYYFTEEGVSLQKITQIIYDEDGNPIGRESVWPDGLLGLEGLSSDTTNPRTAAFLDYAKLDQPAIDRNGNPTGKTWRHYLEKAFADRERSSSPFIRNASPEDFTPFRYNRTRGTTIAQNPSIGTGANVTYTDEATGYDMQLIYSPLDNLQFIFSYAHTEREVDGSFHMVDAIDPETGLKFGTEYDEWVRIFGREAFGLVEEDTDGDGVVDKVTKDGQPLQVGDVSPLDLMGGLQGVNLYQGSEDSASIWGKYTFQEGSLKGLNVGAGVIYTGPAPTSVPIGGTDLAENRFGTPPTEERYRSDLALGYRWNWKDTFMSLRLNVYNLTNDQKGYSEITYMDDGVPVPRRTEIYYAPRSYRLSMNINF